MALTLVVTGLVIVMMLTMEIMRIGPPDHTNTWEITTCKLPPHVLQTTLVSLSGVQCWSHHSPGYEYAHIPFDTDLQAFSDFSIRKLFKYANMKSVLLQHLYNVRCVFTQTTPDFVLQPPLGHRVSLVLLNLDKHTPLRVTNTTSGKRTNIAPLMFAITPIHQHGALALVGTRFVYGYFVIMTTLDYY